MVGFDIVKTYCLDFETTDLMSDIGSLIVCCFAEIGPDGKITQMLTEDIQSIGKGKLEEREKKLALWARARWNEADILIGQNHLAFDRRFLDGVLFRYSQDPVQKRILIDTYQTAKGQFRMSASMKNLVDIMGIGEKDAPSKDDWRKANHGDKEALARIRERCMSDVRMTNEMWNRLKPTYYRRWGR